MNARNDAPLRSALQAQLDDAVQRHGSVLWLDPRRAFTLVVRSLEPRSFVLVCFDGSWLEAMLALETHSRGNEQPRLVLYVPGFDEKSVEPTPALAFAACATRFAPTVDRLVRDTASGVISPGKIEAFLSDGAVDFARAERWLADEQSAREEQRSALFARLTLDALLDELLARSWKSAAQTSRVPDLRFETAFDVQALEVYLRDRLGIDERFRAAVCGRRGPGVGTAASAEALLSALTDDLLAWILSVEYVFDLRSRDAARRRPVRDELAPLVELHENLAREAIALCVHLRRHHEALYPAIADQVEQLLRDELSLMSAEDLGRTDTFAIENKRVLEAAVSALTSKRWSDARERAADRLRGDSIWLRRDQLHRWEWQLVLAAAEFGETLQRVGGPSRKSVERTGETLADLVAWYESFGYEVDLRHRRFEQEKAANLDPRFANFADLQRIVQLLREQYREWVDAHAQRWTECCEARGYLAPSELQQRTLYEQIVQPLVDEGERVALFLVDALRYEMARDLAEMLQREAGTTVTLRARVAELPTITAVGMNCVVPVTRGDRLVVAGEFNGFRSGEITVARPEHRADAAGRRSLGKKALLLDLSAVLSDSAERLSNRIRSNKLVLVQTREIDDAGEANVGVRSFQGALQDLLSAYRLLEAAGVQRFVFVADHGFLLQDECTKVQPFGTKRVPRPRYVIDTLARVEENVVAVNPRSLGYEGDEIDGRFLLFRRDTAVFSTGRDGAAFVHGGNSPQERVIPVLEARTPPRLGRSKVALKPRFSIAAEADVDVSGVHQLRLMVLSDPDTTTLFSSDPVVIGLRARGDDPNAIVSIRDVSSGTHSNGQLSIVPQRDVASNAWTSVFFTIESVSATPAQVEVSLADAVYEGSARLVPAWFETVRVGLKRSVSSPALAAQKVESAPPESAKKGDERLATTKSTPPAKAGGATAAGRRVDERSWLEDIPDENARKVLARIDQYGMVTENEATEILGSARAMRRFVLQFDEWVDKRLIPIRIRVDSSSDGKRYTKEGDR